MDIASMDDEQLWDLLKQRLGREHVWTELLEGDGAGRVRAILSQQANLVNGQIAHRKAEMDALQVECHQDPGGRDRWFGAKGEYDEWRRRALFFKRLLESRLSEARRAHDSRRRARHVSSEADSQSANREALRLLAVAVAAHQRACASAEIEPSLADIQLWMALDEIRVPMGAGSAALSSMVDNVWT